MLADFIVEKDKLILRNLNKNGAALDVWSSGSSSYNFYNVPYETPVVLDHYYYQRFTYKFTTTNQSPTWSQFYIQGGMRGGPNISNPVAGTEYTASGIQTVSITSPSYTITSGTLYNGPGGAISGVSAQAKNVLIYDVTILRTYLRALGIATTDSAIKTWCDNNLVYVPPYTDYDISNLLTNDATNKVYIKEGHIIANNFIECDGMKYYSYNKNLDNYFDESLSGVSVYNNSGNGTVTHTRISAETQDSPFLGKHPYILQITTNGTASPGAGGLVLYHQSAANKIFVEKIVAKIPVGYTLNCYYNPQGDGASIGFISSQAGTGDWAEYTVLYKCGSSGSFSSGGHLALVANSGYSNTSVTWYIAYANNCDITDKEYLKYYTAMPDTYRFKDGNIYDTKFDTVNLFPNGDASDQTMPLPSGWTYDTEDYAGNAKCSIVQPVNAAAGTFDVFMPIDPTALYKVSYWVKTTGDMSSFLTAIYLYASNKTTQIVHANSQYVYGTKTKLAQDLVSGATEVYLNSVSNWTIKSWSSLGIRNNEYNSTYNDILTYDNGSGGIVGAVDTTNKKITLTKAYSGNTIATGKTVVESFDGSNHPYPINKNMLPTDNTWKYVEGTFGKANTLSDGQANSGGSTWQGIPAVVRYIKLTPNLYKNTSTAAIKFSDIRIEQISNSAGHRYEKKIAFKKHSV